MIQINKHINERICFTFNTARGYTEVKIDKKLNKNICIKSVFNRVWWHAPAFEKYFCSWKYHKISLSIKYDSCFIEMKNINCTRSQYINILKWHFVAEYAESVIMKHKYTVKYALKMNSMWKCKSTGELFTGVFP